MLLKVVIKSGEDKGYVAHAPALRGCWSEGATREEALAGIREAIQAWLEVEQDKAENESGSSDIELLAV